MDADASVQQIQFVGEETGWSRVICLCKMSFSVGESDGSLYSKLQKEAGEHPIFLVGLSGYGFGFKVYIAEHLG